MRPILAYACPVWGYAAKTNINILDTLQNSLIRMIVKAIRYMRNDDILDMTSTTDWSERTDTTEQQPPNSPSRMIAGDDHIAECSDLFREAIQARNVYAAWARKLTNARPK
ncbi:hypothetical protein TNCV_1397671 [Trichonephila clavipes]|nr:hypothetical protein TNCV_1397671 [Trichonephila clavipes]